MRSLQKYSPQKRRRSALLKKPQSRGSPRRHPSRPYGAKYETSLSFKGWCNRPSAHYPGARLPGVGYMVFLKVLMTQHRPICCASMESSLSPATMPCFLKNLPPLGYMFYLRAAMIIAPQTQYFCILCTQQPRERIHSRGFSLRSIRVQRRPTNQSDSLSRRA